MLKGGFVSSSLEERDGCLGGILTLASMGEKPDNRRLTRQQQLNCTICFQHEVAELNCFFGKSGLLEKILCKFSDEF